MAVVIVVWLLPNFWLFLVMSTAVYAVLASSVGLLTGTAGMISLAQMSFAGIGGWLVTDIDAHQLPIPFVVQVLLAGCVAVPIGVVVGVPALHLRGINLAIVTLGFAAVCDVALTSINFPGGVDGHPVLRAGILSDDRMYALFCLGVFATIQGLLVVAQRRRTGSGWLAIKESERAAASMGLNVPLAKLTAFACSAFIAGIGGGLMAGQLGLLSAVAFAPLPSLVLFATAVLAGARTWLGALIAGLLFVGIPEVLARVNAPADVANLLFAIGTLGALAKGHGIADAFQRKRQLAHSATPSVVGSGVAPAAIVPEFGLTLRDLTVRYGSVLALDDVSVSFAAGSRTGIIGPNGGRAR